MEISHRIETNICIFDIGESLTLETVDGFQQYTLPLIEDEKIQYYIFNVKSLKKIDSNGIGVFLNFLNMLQPREGKMAFCEVAEEYVRDILDITDIDIRIPVYETEIEALVYFQNSLNQAL